MFRRLLEQYAALTGECPLGCKERGCAHGGRKKPRSKSKDREKTERGFGGMSRSGF